MRTLFSDIFILINDLETACHAGLVSCCCCCCWQQLFFLCWYSGLIRLLVCGIFSLSFPSSSRSQRNFKKISQDFKTFLSFFPLLKIRCAICHMHGLYSIDQREKRKQTLNVFCPTTFKSAPLNTTSSKKKKRWAHWIYIYDVLMLPGAFNLRLGTDWPAAWG